LVISAQDSYEMASADAIIADRIPKWLE